MKVKIADIRPCGNRIKLLTLVPDGGGSLPEFSAGAHIDLHLANGLIRQYSLGNTPIFN